MSGKIIERGEYMSVSKKEYEDSLKTVKAYEKRQEELSKLNKDLGQCINHYFSKIDFKINGETTYFAGATYSGDLKTGISKCNVNDKFESVIGKLIAIKKSVNEDTEYIYKYIEKTLRLSWHKDLGNMVKSSPKTVEGCAKDIYLDNIGFSSNETIVSRL